MKVIQFKVAQMFLPALTVTSLLVAGCNYRQVKQAGEAKNGVESLSNFGDLSANIFQPKCIHCHSAANASGGVDFSTYSSTLAKSGVVVSGNPQQSLLYTEVASGSMPDGGPVLDPAEVSAISDWILAGAPNGAFPSRQIVEPVLPAEPPGNPGVGSPASPSPDFGSLIKYSEVQSRIFDQACVRCHSGSNPKGKVNLSSYAALLASAKKNLVVPGAPDQSLIFTEISSGSMPPKGPPIAAADIAIIRDWINQGARGDQ